tara:strand:- start:315 stop:902 length:588 start_codon:yes stop_codon:yes gene_type:complete
MDQRRYDYLVNKGKGLVKKIEAYQVKIASYACEVCDIRHGGRSDGIYTLGKYADDIGIHRKTLQNWVQVYRNVVVKVDQDIKTAKQWQAARKTNDVLTGQTTTQNKINNTKNKRRSADAPKAKVQSLYNTIQDNDKPFVMEFNRIDKSAKYIKHVLSKRDLGIIDDASLLHLMQTLDQASDLINDYLTKNKKRAS